VEGSFHLVRWCAWHRDAVQFDHHDNEMNKVNVYQITIAALVFSTMAVFPFFTKAEASSAIPIEDSPETTSSDQSNSIRLPLILFKTVSPPPPPPVMPKLMICSADSPAIPDNSPSGVTSTIGISDPRYLYDLEVRLDVSHNWIGDLVISLAHLETGKSINLLERPGPPGSPEGCGENDIKAIFDDDLSLNARRECSPSPAAIAGIFLPDEPLGTFATEPVAGNWNLKISDNAAGDSGKLNQWCLTATLTDVQIPQPPPPEPPVLPEAHLIPGLTGQGQALPLDCESRSAVDWANYFGVKIGELDFFYQLPESDNPDKGFVGNVYGAWGQIPPNPYGVHAEPVASLLRQYGLAATAHKPLTWDSLRAEVAADRPVIVWIVGSNPLTNGIPIYYLPSDGLLTIVARYEHTVIVTGFTADTVTYLNGANYYTISRNQFLASWSALGNMAITAGD
jgi:uncharacterized protein YvpB